MLYLLSVNVYMQMSFRNPPMLTLQEIMSPVWTEHQVNTQKIYLNLELIKV